MQSNTRFIKLKLNFKLKSDLLLFFPFMEIEYLVYECRNEIDKELKSEKNLPNFYKPRIPFSELNCIK